MAVSPPPREFPTTEALPLSGATEDCAGGESTSGEVKYQCIVARGSVTFLVSLTALTRFYLGQFYATTLTTPYPLPAQASYANGPLWDHS